MKVPLKVGVVGAGVFAGYHASKVAAHAQTRLIGIHDIHPNRTAALAARYDTLASPDLDSLIAGADALIVATPGSHHETAAVRALKAGRHVLVEKPLADTLGAAQAIVAATDAAGPQVLQVGHQERLVARAIGLPDITERPEQIEIVRHGPRGTRNLDTDVVMDLMIHDLDMLHWLFGTPDWTSTEMARRTYSDHWDAVRAELGYGDMTAYLSASRDAQLERRWRLRYASGTVEIDFGAKALRNGTDHALDADFGARADVQDSLGAAFDRFVSACLDGAEPLASGADGLAAVRMATAITEDA